mmetsp:Transcript_86863/g.153623  ORF Transcript_86863/g.153623 Transcript_86863/m.153623 type:complete len:89 (+) Transcript_86863:66-332(+)
MRSSSSVLVAALLGASLFTLLSGPQRFASPSSEAFVAVSMPASSPLRSSIAELASDEAYDASLDDVTVEWLGADQPIGNKRNCGFCIG